MHRGGLTGSPACARLPARRACSKKKCHPKGVTFLFVIAHRLCRWYSRIPQGRGSVRGKPLRVSPLAFNHPPAGAAVCAADCAPKRKTRVSVSFFLVPVTGLEPVRCRQRWILSPLRLPIPSHRQGKSHYTGRAAKKQEGKGFFCSLPRDTDCGMIQKNHHAHTCETEGKR